MGRTRCARKPLREQVPRARGFGVVQPQRDAGPVGCGCGDLALRRSGLGEAPEAALLPPEQRWLTLLTDGIA